MTADKRKRGLSNIDEDDPIAGIIPSTLQEPERRTKPAPDTTETAKRKERATYHIPVEVIELARNTVYHLSGPPVRLTLADLVENAIRREVARLEREHNDGQPFPPRERELRGGRPIKT